jgi:hypothetical protein
MSDLKKALEYLTQTIGLCHTPREQWSDTDHRIYREAREFVQKQKEHVGESQGPKTSIGTVRETEAPKSEDASRRDDQEGISIQTGNENP